MPLHNMSEFQTREGVQHAALTMAFGIIAERVKSLAQDDRDDLYELAKDLPQANCGEDMDSIFSAMMEILDQKPIRLRPLDHQSTGGLQKWMDFVSGRIKFAREAAGLTQDELANKTGLPQSHISRLETGKHSPSNSTLEKIARALDVPMSRFDPSE